MQSLVSIIIPVFNNAETIQETLDSIITQTYTEWECFIVDDNSSDTTKEVLQKLLNKEARINYFERPKNKPKGANACRNYGLELCKGDFIMFLDADDILHKTCLKNRVDAFKSSLNAEAVVADTALWIDGEFKTQSINNDPDELKTTTYRHQFLSYKLPWTIMSVLWKRSILKNMRFDEALLRFQDVDFHINVLNNNFEIIRLKRIDNYYRVDPSKIHNEQHVASVLNNLLVFFNKHIKSISSVNTERLAFQKFINYFLQHYLFPNYHSFKPQVSLLLNAIYTSGLYSNKQLRLIKTQMFLVKTKLNKTKYIGIYSLNNFIKKELANS